MSPRLAKEDENTLPFKGRERVGMGFSVQTHPLLNPLPEGEEIVKRIFRMKEIIKGRAYVLGNDIDTDQIIPAQHLVYSLSNPEERKMYGRYALSSVPEAQAGLPEGNIRFVEEGRDHSQYNVIIAGKNFGCGSSREHAPIALNIAGVEAVIAETYARIFYRNVVDGGFFIPFETEGHLYQEIRTGDQVEIDVKKGVVKNLTAGKEYPLRSLGDVEGILRAGDIFAYARQSGIVG